MIKKLTFWAILMAAVFALFVPLVGVAQDNGATVYDGVFCIIGSQDSGLPDLLISYESIVVIGPGGHSVVTCHFRVPEGWYDGPAIQHRGFECSVYDRGTYNSVAITNRNRVTLVCRI
jgi:hypothetical protein